MIKNEILKRINSICETNIFFTHATHNRLGPSRYHELHDPKLPFVSLIECIRSKLSIFPHVNWLAPVTSSGWTRRFRRSAAEPGRVVSVITATGSRQLTEPTAACHSPLSVGHGSGRQLGYVLPPVQSRCTGQGGAMTTVQRRVGSPHPSPALLHVLLYSLLLPLSVSVLCFLSFCSLYSALCSSFCSVFCFLSILSPSLPLSFFSPSLSSASLLFFLRLPSSPCHTNGSSGFFSILAMRCDAMRCDDFEEMPLQRLLTTLIL